MGNWIGRDGRGINAASTLWFSSRNSIQIGYRQGIVDSEFDHGGHYQDGFLKTSIQLGAKLDVSAMMQYEDWRFPLLAPNLQNNLTSSIQITYQPSWKK
jgi:hypothetical protein